MKPLLRDELAELLTEYANKTRRASTPPAPLPKGYDWFDWNAACNSVPAEQTPRARKERAILRIAMYYPAWGPQEVQRLLDRHGATAVEHLSQPALERVFERMRALEDSAASGCELPEAPPAY